MPNKLSPRLKRLIEHPRAKYWAYNELLKNSGKSKVVKVPLEIARLIGEKDSFTVIIKNGDRFSEEITLIQEIKIKVKYFYNKLVNKWRERV